MDEMGCLSKCRIFDTQLNRCKEMGVAELSNMVINGVKTDYLGDKNDKTSHLLL
jgi:hypothetical protein